MFQFHPPVVWASCGTLTWATAEHILMKGLGPEPPSRIQLFLENVFYPFFFFCRNHSATAFAFGTNVSFEGSLLSLSVSFLGLAQVVCPHTANTLRGSKRLLQRAIFLEFQRFGVAQAGIQNSPPTPRSAIRRQTFFAKSWERNPFTASFWIDLVACDVCCQHFPATSPASSVN